MRRVLFICLVSLLALLAAVAGAALYLVHDEDFLKARLAAFVLEESGREFGIDGRLQVGLGREAVIEASGVRLSNPAWADTPEMLRIGRLRLVIDLPSLFGRPAVLPSLQVEDCQVELLENPAGETNWSGLAGATDGDEAEREEPDGPAVRLLEARVGNCVITYDSPRREQPLRLEVDDFVLQLADPSRWEARGAGRVNDEALSLSGRMEPARALVQGGPAELALDLQLGRVALHGEGRFRELLTGAGADLSLNFSGPELARVLSHLGLPPVSEGPFDFRLSLDSQGAMTRLQLDGDLGRLQAHASGQLDRLVHPTGGKLQAAVTGPDFAALGRVFELDGLAAEPYRLETAMAFEPGRLQLDDFELEAGGDRLTARGVLGTRPGLADSDLQLELESTEVAGWAGAWGGQPALTGALALDGRLASDASGRFAFTGNVKLDDKLLTLEGPIGSLPGSLQADVRFNLHADRPQPLAAQFGAEGFPDAPVAAHGRLGLTPERLQLGEVQLSLGGHRGQVDGVFVLQPPYVGTGLSVSLESPSAAELGRMLGQEGLPDVAWSATGRVGRPDQRIHLQDLDLAVGAHRLEANGYLAFNEPEWAIDEVDARLRSPDLSQLAALLGSGQMPAEPIDLSLSLQRQGRGLRFSARQAETGAIRLQASGAIPDLEHPLLMDADFDLHLPRLAMLSYLEPGFPWPEQAVSVSGTLRNRDDRVQLEGVQAQLGTIRADVSGELRTDGAFELDVAARGDDSAELQPWVRLPLAPGGFSVDTQLTGKPGLLGFNNLDAALGENRLSGDLQLALGDVKRLSGSLQSPYLDLGPWLEGQAEAAAGENADAKTSAFLFDDTPIQRLVDMGWELDLDARIARAQLGTGDLRDVEIGVRFADRRLEIRPFRLAGAYGGHGAGHFVLDSSGESAALDVELRGNGVRSGLISPPNLPRSSVPTVDIDLALKGSGRTRRELASGLNGRVRMFVGPGQIASSSIQVLFTDFLSELFTLLNPFAEKSESTRLECAVAAANIEAGRMEVYPVVFNTEEITIFSQGEIDLRSERVDLSFNTKPRKGLGITTGVLINPLIKVGGTLAQPAIEFDPANAIVSGGTAVATAGLSLLAKGFADRFLASKDPCGDARKEIEQRDNP